MDANDEKFFEQLAGAKADADRNYEVELAKARTGILTSASRPKVLKNAGPAAPSPAMPAPIKIEMETEEEWTAASDASDGEPEGQLTVDVYQTANDIVVESAIAGVRPENIDVNVTTDSISIRGSRHREKTVRDEDYLYQECYWGRFARSIILPQEVDPEGAEVTLKNGILTVKMPKANKKKSRKLRVRVE